MNPAEAPAAIEFSRFLVVPQHRQVLAEGRALELGGRAFDVLMALIEGSGAVVSKKALMERVWPGRIVEEGNLMAQISALRRAFGADRKLIRTVAMRGYQFTGEIRRILIQPNALAITAKAEPPSSRPATNLPEPVSALIGRDAALDEIIDLSTSHRLVTLTGTGGIGKTRLAFEAARRLLPKFSDGAWAIELATLSNPALVPTAVATGLGLELASGTASSLSVASALRSKQLLLVLDNCEHVVYAAAQMAERLLRTSPDVCVIATSREPLLVEGERVYAVPPLAVPADGDPSADDPLRFSAVRLFVERARAASPSFSPDASVLALIGRIAHRLDGIPLAIELAAARVNVFGIEGLVARLDDRFSLLTSGWRTALPRHQTLRAMLDWGYGLLTEPERVVLGRLAIFVGGFTLQDASAVAADNEIGAQEIVDCVANLVTKSLVIMDSDGTLVRHRLLETTRAYALERLVQTGEFNATARRHARCCLNVFESAASEVGTRPTDEWLAEYAPRIDNVRAALGWAFSPDGDASIGVALTAAAVTLWMHLSLMDECRSRAEQALVAIAGGGGSDARREMQLRAALAAALMYTRGAISEVGTAAAKALEIAESLGDVEYQMRSLFGLWSFRINSGPQSVGLNLAERFSALAAKRSDPADRIVGERMIGTSQHYLGDLLAARHHLEHVLAHDVAPVRKWQTIRFEVDQSVAAQVYLARTLWLQGLPDHAMRTAESSVADARAANHAITVGLALARAACPIALLTGNLAMAVHYVRMLVEHSTTHTLARWRTFGRGYEGVLAIQAGDLRKGLELLRTTFDEPAAAGSAPPFFTVLMAEALGHAGQIADGFAAIEAATARAEHSEERWPIAELLRIKGELLLLDGAPGAAIEAERLFREALDHARRQGALSWELRCATSLARLWRAHPRRDEGTGLLASIYERFTEGLDTADLKTAKALLHDLL